MAATSWSRQGAFRTPLELDLRRPALNWTDAVTFASMADWRRVRQMCGRWAHELAAPNLRTYPKTIFESYATISQVEIAARATAWFHIACSLVLRSPASGGAKAKRNAKASSFASQSCR